MQAKGRRETRDTKTCNELSAAIRDSRETFKLELTRLLHENPSLMDEEMVVEFVEAQLEQRLLDGIIPKNTPAIILSELKKKKQLEKKSSKRNNK